MKLIQITRKGKSVNLIFDEGEKIILPYDLYLQLGIYKGTIINEKEKNKLLNKIDTYNTKQNAFRYLSGRNHSKNELRIKLLRKGYKNEIIKNVIFDLERLGYLNDEDFTYNFYKVNIKKKGINRIKADLYKKGVDRNIIEETGSQFLDDPGLYNTAKSLAKKKMNILQRKKNTEIQKKQKLYQYLVGKGYSTDIIKNVLESFNF